MIKLNGLPVVPTMFPDKTSQVWKLPEQILKETNYFHITWKFESEAEFMHLAQLKTLIDYSQDPFDTKTTLKIEYLPYGRQDKRVSNDSTFGLRTFASLLNSLDFTEVIIEDPHSEVAIDIINNAKATYPRTPVMAAYWATKSHLMCYPDKGALTKYSELYKEAAVYGEKVRNQETGEITDYKLVGNVKDKNILIVDDICDGGMTFKLLAHELYKAGAKEVNLFVSHGLFTKGIKTLKRSMIRRIFTANGEVTEES